MTKAKPILFNAEMVRAILEGRKTQTRRCVDGPKRAYPDNHWSIINNELVSWPGDCAETEPLCCPYGEVGDLLWVRESYFQYGNWEPVEGVKTKTGKQKWRFVPDGEEILFEAPGVYRKGRHQKDPETKAWHKRLGRFMPKIASRITLEITSVRVERLQDISESDAVAEGCYTNEQHNDLAGAEKLWPCTDCGGEQVHGSVGPNMGWTEVDCANCDTPVKRFAELWKSINGECDWLASPWVWAIEFKVHHCNVDAFIAQLEKAA